jgi:predicted phosphodiesterase
LHAKKNRYSPHYLTTIQHHLMKLAIISDVHGRNTWKEITDQNKDADTFIFLGDYFDSFDIDTDQQISNFKEIIEFKKHNSQKVILLTGNHDIHYLPHFLRTNESYSGFQRFNASEISHLILENLQYMQMAHSHNNILFSHAGISNKWLIENCFNEDRDVADYINNLFKQHPFAFRFVGLDPYGDSPHSSPVWIRPKSLISNAYKSDELIQIVGHTQYRQIINFQDKIYFTDAPTSGQYIYIENNLIQIKQLSVEMLL